MFAKSHRIKTISKHIDIILKLTHLSLNFCRGLEVCKIVDLYLKIHFLIQIDLLLYLTLYILY